MNSEDTLAIPVDPKVARLVKSAFDKAFAEIESPDYPATCDQCGATHCGILHGFTMPGLPNATI